MPLLLVWVFLPAVLCPAAAAPASVTSDCRASPATATAQRARLVSDRLRAFTGQQLLAPLRDAATAVRAGEYGLRRERELRRWLGHQILRHDSNPAAAGAGASNSGGGTAGFSLHVGLEDGLHAAFTRRRRNGSTELVYALRQRHSSPPSAFAWPRDNPGATPWESSPCATGHTCSVDAADGPPASSCEAAPSCRPHSIQAHYCAAGGGCACPLLPACLTERHSGGGGWALQPGVFLATDCNDSAAVAAIFPHVMAGCLYGLDCVRGALSTRLSARLPGARLPASENL
jgi:hypothetical protein